MLDYAIYDSKTKKILFHTNQREKLFGHWINLKDKRGCKILKCTTIFNNAMEEDEFFNERLWKL